MSGQNKEVAEKMMRAAIACAFLNAGKTHPNPSVGAVVVKNGVLISSGSHEKAGKPHAEVVALKKAGGRAKGADLYVTLEPCRTYGRTPPCTEAIIRAGIKRVIAGAVDPNPNVNGKGFAELKKNGVETIEGFLKEEAIKADMAYHTFFTKKRPFIHLKWAQSVDGATALGEKGYITGEEARRRVHEERFLADAIVVTSGTVRRDNPRLTVRLPKKKKPLLRVVLDRKGPLELPKRFSETAPKNGEIWLLSPGAVKPGREEKEGVERFVLDCGSEWGIFFPEALKFLRKKMVLSLYVEAVGELAAFLIREKWVDRLSIAVSPILLGRGAAPAPISRLLDGPVSLAGFKDELLGADRFLSGDLEGRCLRG